MPLDVVVRQSAAILQLLATKIEPLLVRWDAFCITDLSFHILSSISGPHLGDKLIEIHSMVCVHVYGT